MVEPALVAIVDDDESLRKALKRHLQSVGLRAETFASAEEFLRSPHIPYTACLIVDVVMPGLTGLDLQRNLMAKNQSIPIIFITAHDEEHVRKQALELGAVAILRKPVLGEALVNTINSVLDPGARGFR